MKMNWPPYGDFFLSAGCKIRLESNIKYRFNKNNPAYNFEERFILNERKETEEERKKDG
jgi:hypothetical protein